MKGIILGAGAFRIFLAWLLVNKNRNGSIIDIKNKVGALDWSTYKNIEGKNFILDSGVYKFHSSDEVIIKIWTENFAPYLKKRNLFAANCKCNNLRQLRDYQISNEVLKKGFIFEEAYKKIRIKIKTGSFNFSKLFIDYVYSR